MCYWGLRYRLLLAWPLSASADSSTVVVVVLVNVWLSVIRFDIGYIPS